MGIISPCEYNKSVRRLAVTREKLIPENGRLQTSRVDFSLGYFASRDLT